MRRVAHGNMKFVRGDHAETRIAKFPPKLVPDCGYLHRLSRLRRVLDRVNDSRRREKQHDHDQDGNDGPGEFNLRASIYLRWFALQVRGLAAELYDDVTQ
jgi:hypothetical protein